MRDSGAPARPPDIYRRAFRLTLPYWRRLSGVLVLSLLAGLPGQLWPLLLVPLLDDALLGGDFALLLQLAALMAVMQIGGLVLTSYTGYRYVGLSAQALFDLRLTVYRRLQRLSPRFFAGARTGDLLSRLNTDVSELQRTAGDLLLSLSQNVLGLLVALVLVLALAPALLVPALLVLPLAAIALTRLRTRVTDENRRLREAGASVGSALVESVLGMRQTVAFGQEEREARRFRGENDRFIDALLRARRTTYVASGIPASLVSIAGAAAFLYGGYQVIQGSLTLGVLGAAMTYQMRLFGPVQGLLGQYLGLRAARASFERVFELLDEPPGVEDPTSPVAPSEPRGPLRVEAVSLSYGRGEEAVLDGASVTLPERTLTVLVGPSGVGKTTLTDLILRRLDPDSGSISWGGTDIRRLSLARLRSGIAVVEQDPFLWHAPIGENIRYGRPAATQREIAGAVRLAALDDFVAGLPEGLSTVVGERGQQLSAGQRQRIAIARAILANPDLVLLDEPSSALDAETEALLIERLAPWLKQRTALVMTHRRAFAAAADQVFALRDGRIAPPR
jgi:ATP-binding cassette subfamily B protein